MEEILAVPESSLFVFYIYSTSIETLLSIWRMYLTVPSPSSLALIPDLITFLLLLCAPTDSFSRLLFMLPLNISLPAHHELPTMSIKLSPSISSEEDSTAQIEFTIASMPRPIYFARRTEGGDDGSPVRLLVFSKRPNVPFTDSVSLTGRQFWVSYWLNYATTRHHSIFPIGSCSSTMSRSLSPYFFL